MNSGFLAVAAVMTVGAILFALWPSVRAKELLNERWHQASVFTVVLIPLVAFSVYAATGNPEAVSPGHASGSPVMQTVSAARPGQDKGLASVDSLVEGLAERLRNDPNDGSGWLLLAKSYQHLNRTVDAASAYARAKELGMSEPKLDEYFEADPAGTTSDAIVRGRVSMTDNLRAEIAGDATVFIIARSGGGSPVPLAVLRTRIQDLPYTFEMSDANAMIQSKPLSAENSIVISVKISTTGEAMDTLPALGATSSQLSMGNAGFIDLEITRL
jgi:hypothetical protein